jgi:hypothetical protein
VQHLPGDRGSSYTTDLTERAVGFTRFAERIEEGRLGVEPGLNQ